MQHPHHFVGRSKDKYASEGDRVHDYLKNLQSEGDNKIVGLTQLHKKGTEYRQVKKDIWFEETNRNKVKYQCWHFPKHQDLQKQVAFPPPPPQPLKHSHDTTYTHLI